MIMTHIKNLRYIFLLVVKVLVGILACWVQVLGLPLTPVSLPRWEGADELSSSHFHGRTGFGPWPLALDWLWGTLWKVRQWMGVLCLSPYFSLLFKKKN